LLALRSPKMSQSSFPSLPPLLPAGGLAFPPALPGLSFTFSDGGVYQSPEEKQHEIVLSKHQLAQQALVDSVIPACETLPNTVLQIITFNSRAQLLPNPKDFARVYADLGTNFESAFKCLSETESALKPETRHVKLLLTDGYDSSQENRKKLMATDEHVGIFDGIMGIGPDVDLAFLKHLSSKNPDTFTHACDPVTLQNAIKALCFGGANAIARDVSVVFWIENRNVYIPTDPSITVETVDMMDVYADPSVPVSNLFACDYCPEKNVFIFSVAQSSASASASADAVQTVVTLLVDISGSMNDGVVQTRSRPIYASSKNEGGGFLKVTVKLRMLDDVYKFLGKGNPSLVEIQYTGRNGEVCREIVSGSTVVEEEPAKTFGACETMLGIMRGLESSSTDINALYRSKLACRASILQDPSISDYMKKLFSFVWDRLRNAYKMTLSAYDRFLERGQGPTESPCMMQLVHTLSAGASDTTASSASSASASSSDEEQSKCSICFDAESTILCLPCKHIGSCEPCFKKTFESASASASCPPCPFCKTPVEEVRQITSIKCPCCESPATRVGVCRHPLACGKAVCRHGDPSAPAPAAVPASGDTLYCHTCKEYVGSFHVWHQ
jgi:Zinc finger, C3HC4 type (RING finger)